MMTKKRKESSRQEIENETNDHFYGEDMYDKVRIGGKNEIKRIWWRKKKGKCWRRKVRKNNEWFSGWGEKII